MRSVFHPKHHRKNEKKIKESLFEIYDIGICFRFQNKIFGDNLGCWVDGLVVVVESYVYSSYVANG